MMNVVCPYCERKLALKSLKAGRYKPKCTGCGQAFLLSVAADESVRAAKLPGLKPDEATQADAPPAVKPRAPVAAANDATLTPEEAAAHHTKPAPRSVAADPDETQAPAASEVGDSDATQIPADAATAANDMGDETQAPADSKPSRSARTRGSDDATVEPTRADDAKPKRATDLPEVIGNYDIVKQLGKGGMGAVYLARQRSLDRPVALKVIHPQFAANPAFLVRFTREAFAAAQLVHHNVVQVYDIGASQGINYFSMEFVEGSSLGDLIKSKGKLEPKAAVGYVLQAARGLAFAHERGMVHRDIKPDNLMLNRHGIVKVADLGLVRTLGASEPTVATDEAAARSKKSKKVASEGALSSLGGVTTVGQTMGTPSYMAPEQAEDATAVDERADIYSLGCTLYALVTGKPVFQGKTAVELMMKHMNEPVVRPEIHVKSVPPALSNIILKALAKKPEERYQKTTDFIATLEEFLGGDAAFQPGEEEAAVLTAGAAAYLGVQAARRRRLALTSFAGVCALGFVFSLLFGSWLFAGGFLGLGVLTGAAYFIISGLRQRTPLFLKARAYVLGSSLFNWFKMVLIVLLCLAILYFVGLLWVWLGVCVAAVGLAFAFDFLLDRPVAKARQGALADVEKMFKKMRLKGLAEEAIQEFACKYIGEHWEEVFEALFDYETKLAARDKWGKGPKGPRPKYAAYQDVLIGWLDARERQRQEARERKHLQKIEQKNLEAQGLAAAEAKRQAEQVAEVMVEKAAEIKQEARAARSAPTAARPKVNLRDLYEAAERPLPPRRRLPVVKLLTGLVLGAQTRLLLGAALLLACLAWLHQNQVADELGKASLLSPATWQGLATKLDNHPLSVPMVPAELLRMLSRLATGVAGVLLLLSIFLPMRWLALVQLAAAALMILGPTLGVPSAGPLSAEMMSLAGGVVLSLGAFVVAWKRRKA
jgi:hypothetical protein